MGAVERDTPVGIRHWQVPSNMPYDWEMEHRLIDWEQIIEQGIQEADNIATAYNNNASGMEEEIFIDNDMDEEYEEADMGWGWGLDDP